MNDLVRPEEIEAILHKRYPEHMAGLPAALVSECCTSAAQRANTLTREQGKTR